MYLNENEFLEPMKLVYSLSEELKNDPEQVVKVQKLTLDQSKPHKGLSGRNGLFGSKKWWEKIAAGAVRTKRISGVIERVFSTGMDEDNNSNTIDILIDDDWSTVQEGIYVDSDEFRKLFRVGARVEVLYILEELKPKKNSTGVINFSEIVLEMAVSV